MTWLTSLPAAVLVISGLLLALLASIGSRLAVRALIPAAERERAHTIAAPLMPALEAIFALLMALAKAKESKQHQRMRKKLEEAQEARGLRLTELRHAAAQVALIGEYYKLRARSTRATYGGILCTLLGAAAILTAFTWPLS
jgi:hypothetical protein